MNYQILKVLLLILVFFSSGSIQAERNEAHNKLHSPASGDIFSQTTLTTNDYATLKGHAWDVRNIEFSPDGNMLASAGHDGMVILWDVNSGTPIYYFEKHHYNAIALSFSPDGSILATGGWDSKINFWNISTGEFIKAWSIYPNVIMDLEFTVDGKSLAIGGGLWNGMENTAVKHSNTIQLFDFITGLRYDNFTGHEKLVTDIELIGTKLLSSSWDGTVKIWNITNYEEINTYQNHTNRVMDMAISANRSLLATASFDKTVNIWNLDSNSLSKSFECDNSAWSVAFSGDDILAVSTGDIKTYPAPTNFWRYFGPKEESYIQIWDIEEKSLITTLSSHNHIIEKIAYSADASILASASWDWSVKLWGNKPNLTPIVNEDTIEEAAPESVNLNSTELENILQHRTDPLHSVLIVKEDKLVYEKYYVTSNKAYSKYDKHVLFSASKSFTSALIGIAIDQGFINSIDQKVIDFFPEMNFSNLDTMKRNLSINHLLTMTSGIDWFEGAPTDDLVMMSMNLNPVQYVLDQKMVTEPGTYFRYNTGASYLLAAIIAKTSGMTTKQFALKYLFTPLGMTPEDVLWMSDSNGYSLGGIGLFLTPRNMAKFGMLYANNGIWNGDQIISKEWIEASSNNQILGIPIYQGYRPMYPVTGYGYQFWISDTLGVYAAEGYQGKMIIIDPISKAVVVFTSTASPRNLYKLANLLLNATAILDSSLMQDSRSPLVLISFVCIIFFRKIKY
ncbi:MAG: serine hydrolase [Candidatus Heimdallarchaeota archaeon]|nr:serine hydrolase [Candidatus Heimdallarchaeota archaeon]